MQKAVLSEAAAYLTINYLKDAMVNDSGFRTWANIGDMSAYGDADDEDVPVRGAAAQLALHQQQPAAAPGPDLRDEAGQGGEEDARPRGGGHGGEAGR